MLVPKDVQVVHSGFTVLSYDPVASDSPNQVYFYKYIQNQPIFIFGSLKLF